MRTFQGKNPKGRSVSTRKCNLPANVEVHIIDDGDDNYASKHQNFKKPRFGYGTVPTCIGVYTVQCAQCFKWRVVPIKQKYEELKGTVCQKKFLCERAREWNHILTCDDPEDMSLDGDRVWAIDMPNIAQPPSGWDREVRLRGASNKFADVYYISPSGKKMRSLVEIRRYLANNPQYTRGGVNLSQFSFTIPKPLHEVCAERPAGEAHESPELSDLAQVDPLRWAAPHARKELLGEPGSSSSNPLDLDQPEVSGHAHLHQAEASKSPTPPRKKRTARQLPSRKYRRAPPAPTGSS